MNVCCKLMFTFVFYSLLFSIDEKSKQKMSIRFAVSFSNQVLQILPLAALKSRTVASATLLHFALHPAIFPATFPKVHNKTDASLWKIFLK